MSWLGKFFGGGGGVSEPKADPATDYNGYSITPTPMAEGKTFRLAARIERDGKRHDLIRADTFTNRDEAVQASIAKARQVIDEQGARLFT